MRLKTKKEFGFKNLERASHVPMWRRSRCGQSAFFKRGMSNATDACLSVPKKAW
jgi:hypothetical protein